MKFKEQLWAVALPAKRNTEGEILDVVKLAIGENGTPALFHHRKAAARFVRELATQAELKGGRAVRAKVTIKIKKGGRK